MVVDVDLKEGFPMDGRNVETIGVRRTGWFVAFRTKRAFVRIYVTHRDDVFVHVVAMRMMQMAVVKIIHMSLMHDGDVSAIFAVDVRMIGVCRAGMRFVHRFYFWFVCLYMRLYPNQLNHLCNWCGKKCFCKRLALIP